MNLGLKMLVIPFIFFLVFSLVYGLLAQAWLGLSVLLGLGTTIGLLAGIFVSGEARKAIFIASTLSPVEFALSLMVFNNLALSGFPTELSAMLLIIMNILYGLGILLLTINSGVSD